MADAGKRARWLRGRTHSFQKMTKRRALKLTGVALALVVMCLPIVLWPAEEGGAGVAGGTKTKITVPPVVLVPVTLQAGDAEPSTTETVDGLGSAAEAEPVTRITIAAVGDITMHEDLLASAWDGGEKYYDFGPILAPVAPYLAGADYTVCSLETRLAGAQAGYSGQPLMNAPSALSHDLAEAGVDLAATANDHSLDWGWQGIVGTLGRLEAAGIASVGTYQNSIYKKTPFVVDISGIKVAFLNYTSTLGGQALPAGHEGYAVNLLNVDAVAEEAAMARMYGADVVIALLHYGIPYQREPSSEQTAVSEGSAEVRGLLSRGVDVIVGTQPRVVQRIQKVLQYTNLRPNDTYVVYSLGSFLSAERWRYADSGLIAYINIEKQGLKTDVTAIRYLPVYVQESREGTAEGTAEATEQETEATEQGTEQGTAKGPAKYRILPVLPWLHPATDTAITPEDTARMDQVWEELRALLYRPDEGIVPVMPTDLQFE